MFSRHLGETAITGDPTAAVAATAAPTLFDQARQEAGPSEEPAYYVFKYDLAAKESQPNLSRFIDGDSDFILLSIHGKGTGAFNFSYTDAAGRPIYSTPVDASLAVGNAQLPVETKPALFYPSAGRIGISLEDTSNAANSVQLIFTGIRRFRTR